MHRLQGIAPCAMQRRVPTLLTLGSGIALEWVPHVSHLLREVGCDAADVTAFVPAANGAAPMSRKRCETWGTRLLVPVCGKTSFIAEVGKSPCWDLNLPARAIARSSAATPISARRACWS